ncbi:MAG: hypothetical protein IPG00_03090 [Saprospiraceae bacterium]|nr:hypothetical protein [Saprospiraceae bacterium]
MSNPPTSITEAPIVNNDLMHSRAATYTDMTFAHLRLNISDAMWTVLDWCNYQTNTK